MEKVSKMQEKGDADVGKIENYEEEQGYSKESKKEREEKTMRKLLVVLLAACMTFAMTGLSFALSQGVDTNLRNATISLPLSTDQK